MTAEPLASTCRVGTTASAAMVTMTMGCSPPMENHVKTLTNASRGGTAVRTTPCASTWMEVSTAGVLTARTARATAPTTGK